MTPFRRTSVALLAVAMLPLAAAADPPPLPPQAPSDGALPASAERVERVGDLRLTGVESGVGDVSALGTHAYLAGYAGECFADPSVSDGPGIHVVDFSVPQLPRKVAFIPAPANAYIGEGVHAISVRTRSFRGDLLAVSMEPCDSRRGGKGGLALYDISDPTAPVPLSIGAGDRTPRPRARRSAHSAHSVFAWQQGKRAYAVLQDNEEGGSRDVDIMDITNPRRPRLIAETGLPSWRKANRRNSKQLGTDGGSFHHDVWVKKVGRNWLMLVSYWDTGWVVLNVNNPRKPRFVRDSDYPRRDPLTRKPTEGNAHQAVWSNDNRYIIGANEDLFAKFTGVVGGTGTGDWFEFSREVPRSAPLGRGAPAGTFSIVGGPSIYGGIGCAPFGIPAPSQAGRLKPGEIPVVVLQEGVCDPAEKLNAAHSIGYRAAILASSHETSGFGLTPNRVACSEPAAEVRLIAVCLGHARLHAMFDATGFSGQTMPLRYADPGVNEPKVGARGDYVRLFSVEDGTWGDLRLLDARTLRQIDQFQLPEALDPDRLQGSGSLTIHEVKPDPRRGSSLIYASWYGAGMRVLSVGRKGIREVGHYTDGTTDYWGVMPVAQPDGPPLVLMSDMHYGLVILRYTG